MPDRLSCGAVAAGIARLDSSGWPVGDRLGVAKGVQPLLDCEQRCHLELRERAAAADCDCDCGHRDVVRRLPEIVAVVSAERVPEAVQLAVDRLDVVACSLAAVLGVLHQ